MSATVSLSSSLSTHVAPVLLPSSSPRIPSSDPVFIFTKLLSNHTALDRPIAAKIAAYATDKERTEEMRTDLPSYLDRYWGLQERFRSIYVISLPAAEMRKLRITQELQHIGVGPKDFTFFEGCNGRKDLSFEIWGKMHMNWARIDTSTKEGREQLDSQFQGEAGCYMSHFKVIEMVRAKYHEACDKLALAKTGGHSQLIEEAEQLVEQYKSVLIIEDDAGFGFVHPSGISMHQGTGTTFRSMLTQLLKEDWDMLYLEALTRKPAFQYSRNLVQHQQADHLTAYAVNHTMYDTLFTQLKPIVDPACTKTDPVDTTIAKLHASHRCFGAVPSLAYQGGGHSFVTGEDKKKKQKQSTDKGVIARVPPASTSSVEHSALMMPLFEKILSYRTGLTGPLATLIAGYAADAHRIAERSNYWGLKEMVGSIYVITLPHASARQQGITKALAEIGVGPEDFSFFEATDGRRDLPETIWKKMWWNWGNINTSTVEGREKLERQFQGEAGCFLSHLKVLETVRDKYRQAQELLASAQVAKDVEKIDEMKKRMKQLDSVLILEDDTEFGIVSSDKMSSTLAGSAIIFGQAMAQLPKEWAMMHLHTLAKEPVFEFSPNLVEQWHSAYANALLINHTMYDLLCKELGKIRDSSVERVLPVDDTYAQFQPTHRCFATRPAIAYQESGLSYITGKTKGKNQKQATDKGVIPV